MRRSPWTFVPTLYFQQGLPVILVQQFSPLLFKRLGVANDQIGLWTSLLAWPWIVKMLWGPLVDLRSTKRRWTLAMQAVIVGLLVAAGVAVATPWFFPLTLAALFALALASATHDIASDGFYLVALPRDEQAFFLGISNASFRLAMIFCTGALVILAGLLERRGFGVARAWQAAIFAGAAIYALLTVYGSFALPRPLADRPASAPLTGARDGGGRPGYLEAFRTFFVRPRGLTIVLFILLYRFGESMLMKMSGLFLLDARAAGGLGFDAVQAGAVLGSCGMLALVAGGVLGGAAVARFGLRACLWPMALLMHLPNLLYVWASVARPGTQAMYFVAGIDEFAYGFGLASYMVYTMRLCQGTRYQSAHYAIATGLMALGAMAAGITSGFLVTHAGYFWFFVSVCVLSIPGLLLLARLPLDDMEDAMTLAAQPEAQLA